MAVVKYTPLEWQMNNMESIRNHIKQFHEKIQEVGVKHLVKDTDVDLDTFVFTFPATLDGYSWNRWDMCSFTYKLPKGDGTINYTEPDEYGVQEIESFSPKPYDVYLRFRWGVHKTYYRSPNNENRGMCLSVVIEISREDNFTFNITRPTIQAGQIQVASYGTTDAWGGYVKIENESVISFTPDGLKILHGMYTNENGVRNVGYLSPRMVIETTINIHDDGTISIYSLSNTLDSGSSYYNATLGSSHKCNYNYTFYALNGGTTSYNTSQSIQSTPFPFSDLKNVVYGEIQFLPCYSTNHRSEIIETNQTVTLQRGLSGGEHEIIMYRNGKILKRQMYVNNLSSATPQAGGTWSTTWTDYNREYGHIIEYAPYVNLVQ